MDRGHKQKNYVKMNHNCFDLARNKFSQMPHSTRGITKQDVFSILETSGFLLTEQLKIRVLDVITTNASRIDNAKFEEILESLEKNIEQSQTEEQEQSDYIDAFVAMGGNPDKSGHVTKTQIKQIIDEFELTIDLGEYLGKIQEEELCFEDFCDLFDTPFDDTKSYASLRSVYSERHKMADSNGFRFNFSDFEKFMAKNPQYLTI